METLFGAFPLWVCRLNPVFSILRKMVRCISRKRAVVYGRVDSFADGFPDNVNFFEGSSWVQKSSCVSPQVPRKPTPRSASAGDLIGCFGPVRATCQRLARCGCDVETFVTQSKFISTSVHPKGSLPAHEVERSCPP
jgi:hypothetical protein